MIRKFLTFPLQFLSVLLVGLARIYQMMVSPMIKATLGDICRFEPSCSQYFIESVRKFGPIFGTLKGIWRIVRCHPWSRGGFDPP